MDEFLDDMYLNLMEKVRSLYTFSVVIKALYYNLQVFEQQHVLFHTIKVNYNIFKNCVEKGGGHTYMKATERKQYVALIASGATTDVCNISVRLKNGDPREVQIEQVWKATEYVLRYLDCKSDRETIQQSISAKLPLKNDDGYTHEVISGPMFPFLTALYLTSVTTGGIDIVMETYNGKLRAHHNFTINSNNSECSLADATIVGMQLLKDLHFNMPCIMHRFSELIELISVDICVRGLSADQNKFTWGVGCSVSTLCAKMHEGILTSTYPEDIVTNNECDINLDMTSNSYTENLTPRSTGENSIMSENSVDSDLTNSNNLTNISAVETQNSNLSDYRYLRKYSRTSLSIEPQFANYVPAFTVINLDLPPFVTLCGEPSKWFVGAPINFGRSNLQPTLQSPSDILDDSSCSSSDNSDIDDEHPTTLNDVVAINNKSTKGKTMFPNVAVQCKSHVTYNGFGGILPFKMQPTTVECSMHLKTTNFKNMKNVIRTMTYNIAGKLFKGENNVPVKCSVELGRLFYDIVETNENGAFNMGTCAGRHNKFLLNNEFTLRDIELNGSPGRIEIAFASPSVSSNLDSLFYGIQQTINICITHTESYDVKPIVDVVRFILSGVIAKIKFLEKMMKKQIKSPVIYDELLCIRSEVAALLYVWHSGRGRLKSKHMQSPKLAYMACRPILNRLSKLTSECRAHVLNKATFSYYNIFISHLIDIDGKTHFRRELPIFIKKFEDRFVQKFICGQACSKCFKTFSSHYSLGGFETHSCLTLEKGTLINVTDQRFKKHFLELKNKLNTTQLILLELIKENKHNIFLTGYAGTGKSLTLTVAILEYLMQYGMYTFAVISPTKVAAGLVGGITYHSFMSLGIPVTKYDESEAKEELLSFEATVTKATNHANNMANNDRTKCISLQFGLRIIFIDECSMLSHDQFVFLDYFLRVIRDKPNEPFGGVRIILCGDVLQLPPLVKQPDRSLGARRHPVYFFESRTFQENNNFKVLYLQINHRQGANLFNHILNAMRDGECTDEHCVYINSYWGSEVNYYCVERLLLALYRQFDRELISLKLSDDNKRSTGKLATYAYGRLDRLIFRMNQHWNPKLLRAYFMHMYDEDTLIRKSNVDFTKTKEHFDQLQHIMRLQVIESSSSSTANTMLSKTQMLYPVICMENVEIKAIGDDYNVARNTDSFVCDAIDTCDNALVEWDDKLISFLDKESKMERRLEISKSQYVTFNRNDINHNASNNQRGKVVDVAFANSEVVSFMVAPVLVNVDLIPHPIEVTRMTAKFTLLHETHGQIIISRCQFPLKAADAFTPNTIQGTSFAEPHIVNPQRCSRTGFGRIYVSCSRAIRESLVFILFPLEKEDIIACPIALAFDKHHRTFKNHAVSDVNYNIHIYEGLKKTLCEIKMKSTCK
jgi:hypothetical protein